MSASDDKKILELSVLRSNTDHKVYFDLTSPEPDDPEELLQILAVLNSLERKILYSYLRKIGITEKP